MADNENIETTESSNGKRTRLPISMKVAEQFYDEIPEPVKLSRGRGQDLGIFQIFVQYLENGNHNNGKGKVAAIEFTGTDSAKQKASQTRTLMVDGKYPVPDGWEWNVVSRPIVGEDGKSTGSALYFQTKKKLAKAAKGVATTTDTVVKRERKSKKNAEAETNSGEAK